MKRYFVFAFLGLVAFSHAMDEEGRGKEALEQVRQRMLRLHLESSSSSSSRDTGRNVLDISEFECKPTEEDKQIHQMALAGAPEKVKALLKKIEKYPNSLRRNWLLLYGAPGTGKSTLAEAIGCHWGKCFFVSADMLMDDHRNTTLKNLNYLFRKITQEPGNKTLVIDEINKLTDHYTSEYTDANATGMALWKKLDRFESDLSFFLIGTTNETKKFPPQLKSRFKRNMVEIIGNFDKRQLIELYLSLLEAPKDPSIDDQFVTQLAEKLQNFSPRDIKDLLISAESFALLEPSEILTPACIEKALQEEDELERVLGGLSDPISDEERYRQESLKLQQEGLKQQREFHDQQMVNSAAARTHLTWSKHGESFSSDEGVVVHLTREQEELLQKEKKKREEQLEEEKKEEKNKKEQLEKERRENPSRLRSFFSGWGEAAKVTMDSSEKEKEKKKEKEE